MTAKQLKAAADRFIERAFLSGITRKEADRLALMDKEGRDMCGWGKEPLRDQLYKALGIKRAARRHKEPAK